VRGARTDTSFEMLSLLIQSPLCTILTFAHHQKLFWTQLFPPFTATHPFALYPTHGTQSSGNQSSRHTPAASVICRLFPPVVDEDRCSQSKVSKKRQGHPRPYRLSDDLQLPYRQPPQEAASVGSSQEPWSGGSITSTFGRLAPVTSIALASSGLTRTRPA